jgi:hypothetical protein
VRWPGPRGLCCPRAAARSATWPPLPGAGVGGEARTRGAVPLSPTAAFVSPGGGGGADHEAALEWGRRWAWGAAGRGRAWGFGRKGFGNHRGGRLAPD